MTIAINVCIELAPYLIFKHVISTSQNICCPHMLDILVSQNVVLLQHVCRPVETVSRFNDKASWKRIWNAIMEMCKCGKWLVQWSPRTSGAYWIWGDIDGVGYGATSATSASGGSRRGDYTLHYSIALFTFYCLSTDPFFWYSVISYLRRLPLSYLQYNS